MRRVSLADWALLASVLASLGWTAKDFGSAQGEAAATIAGSSVSALSDVDTSGANEGDFLRYQSAVWVDATAALSDLSDVAAITTQTDGQVLTYDVTDGWRNEDAAGAESLAQTLVVGASTGGTSPILTAGDAILGSANEVIFGSSASPVTSLSVVVAADGDTLDVSVSGERVTVGALGTTIQSHAADLRLEPEGDQVVVDGTLQAWNATEAAGDYVQIAHDGTTGEIRVGAGPLEIFGVTTLTLSSNGGNLNLDAWSDPGLDVKVEVDGGVFRVVDLAGGELTITPADVSESVTISAVGVSADLILTAPGALTATSTDAALALTADTGGVTITDSSETLSIATTGVNEITIDAGTGSGLFVVADDFLDFTAGASGIGFTTSTEGITFSATGGDGTIAFNAGSGEFELRAPQIEITDVAGTGDGSIAPVASRIVATTGLTVSYAALTASRWLGIDESGGVFSNAGAGGTVTVSLRQPTQSGIVYSFVRVAAQDFQVNPGDVSGGSTWNIEYSGSSMANGEYLSLASAGAKLTIVSDVANTAWVVLEEFGTLTEETP